LSARRDVARIMRRVRTSLRLTQQEFATHLGVALPTISRWENKRHKPSRLALDKVESFLRQMGPEGLALLDKYFDKAVRDGR